MDTSETDKKQGLREKLQALNLEFAAKVGDRVAEIEAAFSRLHGVNKKDDASKALDETAFLTHRMAGSAASFGFPSLGLAASALEKFINEIKADGGAISAEQKQKITTLVDNLGKNMNADPAPADIPLSTSTQTEAKVEPKKQRLVFLIEGDEHLAEDMAAQLGHFGYNAKIFHSTDGVMDAFAESPPAAIITDVTLPEGDMAGIENLAKIRAADHFPLPAPPPAIVISTRDDLAARLAAVRAGAQAYFTKPVDIARLIESLDAKTIEEETEPDRILVVDDDEAMAELYSVLLQSSDMITKTVSNPLEVMEPLADFRPDLILMDINMPDCSGIELASVIRQKDDYARIPIVFLTSEKGKDQRILAMRTGADDFIQKPAQPELLLSSVQSRIARARFFDSMITRDSMTGLINHSKIKEILGDEINRAGRQGVPLTFAMLDLDKFKSINDTYGHLAGDMVIKALAMVLRQRLRKTDVVGRYGGEEFAVILTDTDPEAAKAVLDKIREGFSRIKHRVEGGGIKVTFSCGIAGAEPGDGVEALTTAADQALYKAKQAGRNRVVPAGD